MKHSLKLLASIALIAVASPSFAKDTTHAKEHTHKAASHKTHEADAKKAFDTWLAALSSGKPEEIVKLYDKNATLHATLAKEPLKTNAARKEYFEGLMKNKGLKATVTSSSWRMLDSNVALNSGQWTFSFEKDDKTVEIPARFSFVFLKENDGWKIVEMHSSKVPE